jgi:hypothetical protein
VLVAKATAPAWTPLFGLAAAVVTDGGTLAAHASLIAREYGIPAVVGTGGRMLRVCVRRVTSGPVLQGLSAFSGRRGGGALLRRERCNAD